MVVVDTHALIWWVNGSAELSTRARQTLDQTDVGVPLIVCYELSQLADRGRIRLAHGVESWLDDVLGAPNVTLLPLTLHTCVTAGMFPDSVRDPADRLIVATAFYRGAALVTRDHKIRASGLVETIW